MWMSAGRTVRNFAWVSANSASGIEPPTTPTPAYAVALRPSMVWALAFARPWLPSHVDDFVASSVVRAVGDEEIVRFHRLGPARPIGSGGLQITLGLAAGLTHDDVAALATRVGERLAADGEFRARVDAVSFAIEAADH